MKESIYRTALALRNQYWPISSPCTATNNILDLLLDQRFPSFSLRTLPSFLITFTVHVQRYRVLTTNITNRNDLTLELILRPLTMGKNSKTKVNAESIYSNVKGWLLEQLSRFPHLKPRNICPDKRVTLPSLDDNEKLLYYDVLTQYSKIQLRSHLLGKHGPTIWPIA